MNHNYQLVTVCHQGADPVRLLGRWSPWFVRVVENLSGLCKAFQSELSQPQSKPMTPPGLLPMI
jgi:hypothetical protein